MTDIPDQQQESTTGGMNGDGQRPDGSDHDGEVRLSQGDDVECITDAQHDAAGRATRELGRETPVVVASDDTFVPKGARHGDVAVVRANTADLSQCKDLSVQVVPQQETASSETVEYAFDHVRLDGA